MDTWNLEHPAFVQLLNAARQPVGAECHLAGLDAGDGLEREQAGDGGGCRQDDEPHADGTAAGATVQRLMETPPDRLNEPAEDAPGRDDSFDVVGAGRRLWLL